MSQDKDLDGDLSITVSLHRRQQIYQASNTTIKKVVHEAEESDKNKTIRTQITRKD